MLTHNDCHQNNILMSIKDNREFILIDNEYAGWNPMAMDLAVYINETMNDNSYPGKNGVEWYLDNIMDMKEQEQLISAYLMQYFYQYMPLNESQKYDNSCEVFISKHLKSFQKQVWDCALLNNFFWGVWALSLLGEGEYLKDDIFNYDFAHSRCDMYRTFKQIIEQ